MQLKFKSILAVILAVLVSISPILVQTTKAADTNIMTVELAEGQSRRVGILKQMELTNYPWFNIFLETETAGHRGLYSLSIEEVNLHEDYFAALLNKKIAFITKPVRVAHILDIKFNDELLYKFDSIKPDWEVKDGILREIEISVNGNQIASAGLELPNGHLIEFTGAFNDKLNKAFGQQVTAYFESWTDDNISLLDEISD